MRVLLSVEQKAALKAGRLVVKKAYEKVDT